MRIRGAAWIGAIGLILLLGPVAPSSGQSLPSVGLNAVEQSAPEPSLLPASGLTLEPPSGFELMGEPQSDEPRLSDGLRLQIYDRGLPAPSYGSESEPPSGTDNR